MRAVSALIILSNLAFGQLSFAAIPTPKKLRRQILSQNKMIKKLKQEIVGLENRIGRDHDRYMETVKKKKKIEDLFRQSQQEIKENKEKLNKQYDKTRKSLAQVVALRLSPLKSNKELLGNKILLKSLNQKLTEIKRSLALEELKSKQVKELTKEYHKLAEIEGHILTTLRQLEVEKQVVAKKYMDGLNSKNKLISLQKKSKRLSKKKKNKKGQAVKPEPVVNMRFSHPLEEYIQMRKSKKGVVYSYNGRTPVLAPQTGTVDYVGDLAPFGDVIMINHGDNTRSVLLGNVRYVVSKGTNVSEGQILGYTNAKDAVEALHFDVRKKSTVVNTARLIRKMKSQQSVVAKKE